MQGWAEANQQFGIPEGPLDLPKPVFEGVNAGWMGLGSHGMPVEHVVAGDVQTAGTRCVCGCIERKRLPGRKS